MKVFEGILSFDNFNLKFKEMKTKRNFAVKIGYLGHFSMNLGQFNIISGCFSATKNSLANAGGFDGAGNRTVHCFLRGKLMDASLFVDGIFAVPEMYLKSNEFMSLDDPLLLQEKQPHLQNLLRSSLVIAEPKLKTCLQKTGKDLYFVLLVKLFSKNVELDFRIVCLGPNHLYIYLLHQSILLGKNYLFTNLKSSKFRVENTANYYSALMISSTTDIHLVTLPLLRELKNLMHMYAPAIDEKCAAAPVVGLLNFRGKITQISKDYYELDDSVRFITCFMPVSQDLTIGCEIQIFNVHIHVIEQREELIGCFCTSIQVLEYVHSQNTPITPSKTTGFNFMDLRLKKSLKRLLFDFNSKIGAILAFKHEYPMSNIWYANASNVQQYLAKPECILNIMKVIGWKVYKPKKVFDHCDCDLLDCRYPCLEFVELSRINEERTYENFVLCVVEANLSGFLVTDCSSALPAVFETGLHPMTMGGPHLILLKSFIFKKNILIVKSYTLLAPFITLSPPNPHTAYTLTNILCRQIHNSTQLVSANYSARTFYIRFRSEFIHISRVLDGTIRVKVPSKALVLIDPDIVLDWNDECVLESISLTSPTLPSTSISRVLNTVLIDTGIQDLVTISARVVKLLSKGDRCIAVVSDHPTNRFNVYMDQEVVRSFGLIDGMIYQFHRLLITVVNGEISGVFKNCSAIGRLEYLPDGEVVEGDKKVKLMIEGLGWICVYPVSPLSLQLYFQCLECDNVLESQECACGGEVVLEGNAEIVVQDGSMEAIVVLSKFDHVQRIFGFDIGRVKDRCGFGKVSLKFIGNPEIAVDDQDWLIEHCRSGNWMDRFKLRVTSVPGYLSVLFDSKSPGNIVKPEFMKPRTFKDLEGETHVSVDLKFVKIHVGAVEKVDHVQEAFALLNLR